MGTEKSLGLPDRFELPHAPLSYPGRLMRLLCPIILILFSAVNRLGDQFPVSNSIAKQLIRNDLPGFTAMVSQQPLEKPFSRYTIAFGLQIHIQHFTVLVYRSPQVMLLAVDFDEYFIDVEGVTKSSVLSLQSAGINGTEVYTPEADCFSADDDASLGQQVFDIAMT
jgi:hypothetical protein